LRRYAWPGNVRELEHVVSRAALKLLSRGASRKDIITVEADLLDLDGVVAIPDATGESAAFLPAPTATLREAVEACQRQCIDLALQAQGGNWAQAARQLGVDASNLHKLARRLGFKGDDRRRAHRIGMIAPPRVADGGDMIDVDAQPQPPGRRSCGRRHAQRARLPGLIAGVAARLSGTSSGA